MKFHKRQLILASLVLALATAVYLNWQFSDDKGLNTTGILESTKELGEARYVNTSNVEEKPEKNSDSPTSLSDNTKKYFAQAQANRQKAHEEAEEKLKNLLSSPNINTEIKDNILKQIENLSSSIRQESDIENLIKAKGFEECIVSLENGECRVIVSPGKLNESSAVIIRDIVSGHSGTGYDKIKITETQ